MENSDIMAKHQQFVDDYNSGFDRARLCAKYRLADDKFEAFLEFLKRKGFVLIEPASQTITTHEMGYQILGDEMQFVEITLEPGTTAISDAGVMMYMESGIEMDTTLGDGSARDEGMLGKAIGAGKRVLAGGTLFLTSFTNHGFKKQKISFAAPYPGKIVPFDLRELGGEMICQKEAFLCAAKGVAIDMYFQKNIGVGIFGGEGFIMQRLHGDGMAFVHAGGTLMARDLQPGETLKVDAGCIVALQPSVQFDIQYVGGIKNALFSGEGLFFATVTGPGKVWLQSLPFSRLVALINSRMPRTVDGGTIPGSTNLPVKESALIGGIGGLLGGIFGNNDND